MIDLKELPNKADERATHPQGAGFTDWFDTLLLMRGSSCLKRDVLRNCKEVLWDEWKKVEPME